MEIEIIIVLCVGTVAGIIIYLKAKKPVRQRLDNAETADKEPELVTDEDIAAELISLFEELEGLGTRVRNLEEYVKEKVEESGGRRKQP